MATTRLHRLLQLVNVLQAGEPKSAAELMELLGVSRRTLFRDLKALADSGVPYYHTPGEGYRIAAGYFLPPVNLTVPETMGLMILAKAAAGQRNQPLVPHAMSAVFKLLNAVPEPVRSVCAEMMQTVTVEPGPVLTGGAEASAYTSLQLCIDQQRVCRYTYTSPTDEGTTTGELHPYCLHYANRAWYVIGHSLAHGEVRMFKLVRFDRVERIESRPFRRPEGFTAASFLGNAWSLIPAADDHEVELEFLPMVATNVSEVRWHKSQEQEWLDDGRCVLRFTVTGLREIAWWVCGYADQVIVRKPNALRELVAEMTQRALDNHRHGDA